MGKPTATDFKPAKRRRWLVSVVAPLNGLLIGRHTAIEVPSRDLALLRALPRGCLIAPNHSHYFDAQVTFELTRRARRRVVYMATRELFDSYWGLGGWFYQRMGVFSVNRGGENEEGRRFARSILLSGQYDLLMFPEGEVYLLNDLVMPLKPGVARLAFEAARSLMHDGPDRPVFIAPVAIKYRYTEDIAPALEKLTERIEDRVFGEARTGTLYSRVLALGSKLLVKQEQLHGVTAIPGEDLFDRIRRLRKTILQRLELAYLGRAREGFDFDRARKLMIQIQGEMRRSGAGIGHGGSGRHEVRADLANVDALARDLAAAQLCARSVAFQDDYLLENPTPERTAETLVKIEREVLGTETRTFGKRRAIIRVADPFAMRDAIGAYGAESDEDEIIEGIVIRVQEAIQGALDRMASSS